MLLSDDDVDDYGNDYNDGVGGDDRKDLGLSFFSCIVGTTMIMIMTMMILIVVVKNDDGCGGGRGSGGVVYVAKNLLMSVICVSCRLRHCLVFSIAFVFIRSVQSPLAPSVLWSAVWVRRALKIYYHG